MKLHFIAGFAISLSASLLLWMFFLPPAAAIAGGIFVAAAAGVGKELIYDLALGRGHLSITDFAYTLLGAITSVPIALVLIFIPTRPP